MLALFETLIKSSSYQSELEAYVSAHNPTSPADVERLIKEYTYGSGRIWL